MNKNIKKRWAAALRSGDYKQGQNSLRCDNKFCCLGVLCDLYSKDVGGEWDENGVFLDEDEMLPNKVMLWAEIGHENPSVGKYTLTSHNDGNNSLRVKRKTFKQIANLIQRHL